MNDSALDDSGRLVLGSGRWPDEKVNRKFRPEPSAQSPESIKSPATLSPHFQSTLSP